MKKYFPALFFLVLLASCAPTRYVRPLEKQTHAVSASFGGPVIGFAGAVLPIPFTTVGYGYGIGHQLTGYANVHTTSLVFGNVQTDIGICTRLWSSANERLQLTGNAGLNFVANFRQGDPRLWPQLDLNASYTLGKGRSFIYAGAGSWFEFSKTRVHNEPQPAQVLLYPQLGCQLVRKHFSYTFELKGLQLGTPNKPNAVDYKGIGGNGAIGFYFGMAYRFGTAGATVTSPRNP
ncbi:MAG: hypothetical protein MUC87_15005 [Bacteroidia bacterium]|jgi:hypothetical protein|nr:hypothetical protein [Bacteroidia bacterium]